jgi:hypothetical protein
VAFSTVIYTFVKTGERKPGLGMIECFGIPFDELRVLSLMLHVTGKTKFVLILVVSSAGDHAAGHLGMTREASLVIDLAIEGVA